MSSKGTKTPWLLGAVVLLGVAVAVSRFASGDADTDGSSGEEVPSAKERYLDALALERRQRSLLDGADQWRSALASAEAAWELVRHELVRARTIELAEAGFRERILAEVKDLRFSESSANSVPVPAATPAQPTAQPGAAATVRAIGLRVDLRTDSPAEVYRLIDRIENLSDVRAGVVGVQIKGPGLAQTPGEVTATLDLRAVALIGTEDAP